jgi:D-xylose transport system substrate-binding protein
MTIYLAIKQQAESAAQLAVSLVRGEQPPAGLVTDKTDNGAGQVPTVLLDPIAVMKDNIDDTIIKDGFHSADEICSGKTASQCEEAGIG